MYLAYSPFEQDGYLLTAQITSIVAAVISWVWWPLFVISAPIVVILQTTWCCKMKKAGMIAACILSFLAFVGGLFIGIWMATECWEGIFVVIIDRNDYYNDDYYGGCHRWMNNPTGWVVVAFVDCFLFLLTFLCSAFFTFARYDEKAARWAENLDDSDTDEVVVPVVEMGVFTPTPEATATLMSAEEKNLDHA